MCYFQKIKTLKFFYQKMGTSYPISLLIIESETMRLQTAFRGNQQRSQQAFLSKSIIKIFIKKQVLSANKKLIHVLKILKNMKKVFTFVRFTAIIAFVGLLNQSFTTLPNAPTPSVLKAFFEIRH